MLRRPSGRISALSDSDRPASHVRYEEMSVGGRARARGICEEGRTAVHGLRCAVDAAVRARAGGSVEVSAMCFITD